MDLNELRGLMEAYQQVNAPQELEEEYIDEAEGSYGQTPKSKKAMGDLANARRNKPATEYSQKGEKTKKVKAADKHYRRQDVLSRGLSGGKKSSRPESARGKMDADERSERRAERAFDLETTYGSGSVTKNPKKLRKQKAMGEIDESINTYELVLSYLLDEGFASTEDAADKIILNMSESWFESIMEEKVLIGELNRYEKETGKDYKTGKEVKKGGSDDKAYRYVAKMMRGMQGTPAGQRKKVAGKKPAKAGEYGSERRSPAQIVAKKRADKKRSDEMQSSRFD